MTAAGAALLLATGAVVGVLSGLTGIGGGVLMVPLLYAYHSSLSGEVPVIAAHATSLAVIAPTALFGAHRFGRDGGVEWSVAVPMGAGAAIAAAALAVAAARLPGDLLRAAFAAFLLIMAGRFLRGPRAESMEPTPGTPPGAAPLALAGTGVGALSALLGVGGGVVAIPLLHIVARLPVRKLAPTSLAVIAPAAAAGAAAYALADARGMPAWSAGFVHVGGALPLLLGSLAFVGLGTRWNARIPERGLRLGFAALLAAAALRLFWGLLRGG